VILKGAVENDFQGSQKDEGGSHGMGSSSSLKGKIKSEWEARDVKNRYESGEDRLLI
jgi:hypothetical protein